jgi:ribosomal protein L37AE/L43A
MVRNVQRFRCSVVQVERVGRRSAEVWRCILPTISMFTRPFMGGAFGQLKGLEKRKKECVLILIF